MRARPALLLVLLAGCGGGEALYVGAAATAERAAVYGDDDRRDVWDVPDDAWRDLARASSVAIIDAEDVDETDPRDVRLLGPTLREAYGLCPSERFVDQPSVARCSGVLVDDDLVLTAGHCVDPARFDCVDDTRFVFGFEMKDGDVPATVTSDDVFRCAEVVAFARGPAGDGLYDHAVVRLDRPVGPGRAPAPLRDEDDPLLARERVAVVGFPSGLPLKLDDGGRVVDPRDETRDFFVATTDTFGGSSGSAVYDARRLLVGVLVRGAVDYVADGTCDVAAVYPGSGEGAGEEISYARGAIDAVCASTSPSERLCGDRCFGDACRRPTKTRAAPKAAPVDLFGDDPGAERVSIPAASCGHVDASASAAAFAALAALAAVRRRRSR